MISKAFSLFILARRALLLSYTFVKSQLILTPSVRHKIFVTRGLAEWKMTGMPPIDSLFKLWFLSNITALWDFKLTLRLRPMLAILNSFRFLFISQTIIGIILSFLGHWRNFFHSFSLQIICIIGPFNHVTTRILKSCEIKSKYSNFCIYIKQLGLIKDQGMWKC